MRFYFGFWIIINICSFRFEDWILDDMDCFETWEEYRDIFWCVIIFLCVVISKFPQFFSSASSCHHQISPSFNFTLILFYTKLDLIYYYETFNLLRDKSSDEDFIIYFCSVLLAYTRNKIYKNSLDLRSTFQYYWIKWIK